MWEMMEFSVFSASSDFWVSYLKGMLKPLAATAVVVLAIVLSFVQRLGLEGEMAYSIFRSFLQLSVIGFVLEFIFTQKNAGWILLAYLFMVPPIPSLRLLASRSAIRRRTIASDLPGRRCFFFFSCSSRRSISALAGSQTRTPALFSPKR